MRCALLSLSGVLAAMQACGGAPAAPASKLAAEPWPEADALFSRDPQWIGGDSAYSVDLGNNRVLWLFGDSFIATSPARSRRQATLINNSLAIQTGYNVEAASVKFYWNQTSSGPASFFPPADASTFYWPGHGAMVGNRLILFLWRVKHTSGGLGFTGVGWTAVAIENPGADPSEWKVTPLATSNGVNVTVGSSVLLQGKYLYAFTTETLQPGPSFLARWPIAEVSANSLENPDWLCPGNRWVSENQLSGPPESVANVGESEFSVSPISGFLPYLMIQTSGFGSSPLAYQTSPSLTGPYSGAVSFYSPPERSQSAVMIYSAKMHPEQTCPGYDGVATYCTNNASFNTLLDDMNIYFPKFVKIKWAKH